MGAVPLELQLSQLSLLPPPFQKTAKDAAAGSSVALSRVDDFIRSDSTKASTTRLFLPVLYAVLHQARIPTPYELDTEDLAAVGETLSRVCTAIGLLTPIARIPDDKMPPHVVAYIWPSLWKWIHFIMLHPWCLQDDDETEAELCQISATTISSIYGHQEGNASCPPDPVIRTVVESTVGVQGLVMRAWVNSLLRRDFIAMHPSSLFMMRVASVQLDECVDGAGGTHWHLASFIVKLLSFISADPPAAQIHCAGALVLIAHMIRDQELLLTLLECGFFGALTKMLNAALDEDIDYDVEHDLERIIDILLLIYWSTPKVERWMAEGLEAKLLPALISITQRKQSYSAHKLIHAVSTSLVHYRVASRIETHLAEILPVLQRLIATGQKDKISENVGEFLAWGADRAKFIERFHAHRYVSRQACDNMKCGIILTRAQVRRCSQCRKRYYCSTVCQMIDWREDKHRTVCKNLRNVNPDYGSPIERSFMLALYESDFQAQKAALFAVRLCSFTRTRAPTFAVYTTTSPSHPPSASTPWTTSPVLTRYGRIPSRARTGVVDGWKCI
ncbi:hypothetical protein B0H16DRAFT_1696118 [Mycena metata]|uniref:MYND-type domain-containing protein n=1 Tax=Mycena metata TaxID=1033252 RepID=A0AAD7MWH0_9AGAR|nr:hypothetical protein B0H16DRAFT_1696118 [Mycena metata]